MLTIIIDMVHYRLEFFGKTNCLASILIGRKKMGAAAS